MRCSGFTLLETIVTIVVAAILATLLVVFFNKSVTRSSDPLRWSEQEARIEQRMEEIVARFRADIKEGNNATQNLSNEYCDDVDYVTCKKGQFISGIFQEDSGCDLTNSTDCILSLTVKDPDSPGHELTTIFADYN